MNSICFFIPTGRTFTFRDCEIITNNETVLVVCYKAMSDGKDKTVTMQKSQIVGWSIE